MPYAFKANKVFAKNPDGDGYMSQTVITDKTTNDAIAEIQAAGSTQVANVNSAGTTQTTRVNTAGNSQVTAISNKATELETLMDEADATISKIDALDDIISGLRSLLDLVHPVGSIYISKDPTDPGDMFGGVWSPITDRFLLTAGSTYHVGDADGGEATHTLIESELPEMHKKMVFRRIYGPEKTDGSMRNEYAIHIATGSEGVTNEIIDANVSGPIVTSGTYNPGKTQLVSINIGGNQPHNNMPPYTIVYAWERVQ